jgi:hypothetical protein
MNQFEVSHDENGDLTVQGGWVVSMDGATRIRIGPAPAADIQTGPGKLKATASVGDIYLGGSGRNLLVSGFPTGGPNGTWKHGYPGKWSADEFVLVDDPSGGAAINDGTDDVATLASGGPAGSYASTPYGETLFSSSPFTVTVSTESGWPGTLPDIDVTISSGFARGGKYTASTAANWVADDDSDWTLALAEDGTAELRDDGVAMATREAATNTDPSGTYLSTEAGEALNPEFADAAEPADDTLVNPFKTLTIVYEWTGTPDLDSTTEFLGETVGYPGPYSATYMEHTGDVTGSGGTETVTIDLPQAWEDGLITDAANILCMADWYPPAGGSGPAEIHVTYDGVTTDYTIGPNSITPAATPQLALRILADGTVGPVTGPWSAGVSRRRVPVPPGVVYITVTESGGALDDATGPFFEPSLPANATDTYHRLIAESDGNGNVIQHHLGPIQWR